MTERTSTSAGAGRSGGYEGEDFICHTCGCEIMVKHWGDPRSHTQAGVFLCHCGTPLEPEHGSTGAQGGDFSQDDSLSQGSRAGGPNGKGRGDAPSGGGR
jgi:hypothetical protein